MEQEYTQLQNNALLEAAKRLKEKNNEANTKAFVSALLESSFLSPTVKQRLVETDEEDGITITPLHSSLIFHTLKNSEGQTFFMAYTDAPSLKQWKTNEKFQAIQMGYENFRLLTLANANIDGFVINPFTDNIIIPKEMAARVMAKKTATQSSTAAGDTQEKQVEKTSNETEKTSNETEKTSNEIEKTSNEIIQEKNREKEKVDQAVETEAPEIPEAPQAEEGLHNTTREESI